MLLRALLLAAAALAARADVSVGSDMLAEVLRADLRRNNDDYAEARRRSANVSPAKSFVPKSKYVRPIQNEFEYSGLQRRSASDNITGEGEQKPIRREAEGDIEGQEIREKVEDVGVYRRETGDLGIETGSEGLKRKKGKQIREKKEVTKGEEGKNIGHLGGKMRQGGEEGSSRTLTRTTPRVAPMPTPRRRPPTPRPAEAAPTAKKRYEVRTRTNAEPEQQQYFINESESIEKFNSLSSVRAPETEFAVKRSVATTRRTIKQIVSSVRAFGVTVMRASRDSLEGPAPRRVRTRGRPRARDVRKAKAEREKEQVRKARAAREAQEMQSRIRPPHLRQRPGEAHLRARAAHPRAQQLHVDPALKQLREAMRGGGAPPSQKMLPPQMLDMAPARGPRVHARRLRNKLCDRHFLRPEGPKYDSLGRIYSEKFAPRGRGNYGFDQTRAPRLVLPRCCNCCRKSVLGCE